VTVCGNGVGLLGDASSSCGSDTGTGGIIAPPPGTTPGGTDTGPAATCWPVLGATLVTVGLLALRATRPDTATKGGGDR